jgi:rhomboid protease GluP
MVSDVPAAQTEDPLIVRRVRHNWLTRRPDPKSSLVAGFFTLLLIAASFIFWTDFLKGESWMPAIPQDVFNGHEFWRAWTALFVHRDPEHLFSNCLLFFPFAYLLYGQFGPWIFPGAAFFFGGITNLIVLPTLPPDATLIGVSGVVYWMGAVWLTLYFYLDSRDKFVRRAIKALGVGALLFIPEKFQEHVSYMSHFVGFVLGLATAIAYYHWNRQRFLKAEVVEFDIN